MVKFFWRLFLFGLAIVVAFCLLAFCREIFFYKRLGESVKVEKIEWTTKKKKEDAFTLVAQYDFFAFGKEFQGETHFQGIPFPNQKAAMEAIDKLKKENFTVFFSKNNPKINTLQKRFPFRLLIQTTLSSAIFLYFLLLGHFFRKRLA